MSAALNYPEPYRFSAGVLALLVHLAFFGLLYFGVRWQSPPNEEFAVEMWQSLPNAEVVPEQPPPPAPPARMEPTPPAKVVAPVSPPVKADIEIREKKSRKAELKEKQAKQNEAKLKAAAKAKQEEAERKELEAYSDRIRTAEQERVRKEVAVATQVQVDRYTGMIRSKIRRKIIKVADVPENAEVIYKVTLLPDGMLMDDPVLLKSSGIPAYDEAVARAILLAEPLPVPEDVSLQKMFRELKLSIRP